jgi:nucleotide-binding universal stress UspA family protein
MCGSAASASVCCTVSSPILLAYPPKSGDGSTIAFAAEAARLTGAPLVIVSVQPGGSVLDRLSGGEFEMHPETQEPDLLARLETETAARDVHAEVRVVEHSTPARGLAGAIDELQPRLVVLGSTHRGRLGRVLPGSTAERLIHGAPCPIAVVPRGHTMPAAGLRSIGAAFVPTDEGHAALRVAARLAGAAGARLIAVTVLSPKHAEEQAPGLLAASTGDQDLSENRYARHRLAATDALEAAVAEVSEGVVTEPDVLFQDPVEGLTAASHRVDLMVIGSRAYGPLHAVMLGGVSRRVIVEAACPVLVLPRGAETAAEGLGAVAARERGATT